MKTTLISAALASLVLGAGQAHAVVDAAVSYNTLGLAHTDYLADGRLERARPGSVSVNQSDLPPQPGGPAAATVLRLSASADESGQMDTSSRLSAGGYATSSATWIQRVQNDAGTAQDYSLALSLSNMELALGGWSGDYTTRDFRAGFDVDVTVNGVSVWHAGRSLLQSATGVHTATRGASLGGESLQLASNARGVSYFRVNDFDTQVNLGTLASGAGFYVAYTLRNFSYWDDPAGCIYECGWVSASISDPLSLAAGPVSVVTSVPEPESYAMLLAGLGLLGMTRWRRSRA